MVVAHLLGIAPLQVGRRMTLANVLVWCSRGSKRGIEVDYIGVSG